MKVAIVDDSIEDRDKIYHHVSQYFDDIIMLDPLKLKEKFYTDYDLYFLDIEMTPSGKDIAKKINIVHPQAIFIFMTHHNHYIFETQILNPFYFIRKSHFEDDLKIAMEMFKEVIHDYLSISFNREETIIKLSDIQYIDIYHGKITFHTIEKDIHYWGTLNELQKELPSEFFIRIHHSYIINKNYITSIHGHEIVVAKQTLPISRKYKKSVNEALKRGYL